MITSTFNTRFGDVTITIDDGGTTATFKTLGFATIDYDFDITPDETDIDRVSVFYGRFSIDADNKDSLGNDLYDRLRTNIPVLESVDMKVEVDRVGDNWIFEYKLSRQDLELSEITRKITIKGTADIDNGQTMGEFTFTDPFLYISSAGGIYDAVGVGNLIEHYVDSLNTSLSNVIQRSTPSTVGVSSPIYNTYDINDLPTNAGERSLAILDISSPPFPQVEDQNIQDISQFSVVASLAASEGAIFGTGFDRNFWIHRGSTGTPIEIDWDSTDVLDVDSIELVQAFRDVSVGTRQYSVPGFDVIPDFGINIGVHISLQQWNRRMPKRFQFVDTPGYPFMSEGRVAEKVSSVIEIITTPTVDEALIIYLGAEGNTTFNAVDGDPLSTANDLTLRINNAFSDWEATVVGGITTNPSVRVDYIGTGTGTGQNINITKDPTGIPDMTFTITPNPTALTLNAYNANGEAVKDLRRNALSAYTKVFPIGETFKIRGVFSIFIKPWETFTFINAPSRYLGKEFRLSNCSYDLFQSKMTFKAYEVG